MTRGFDSRPECFFKCGGLICFESSRPSGQMVELVDTRLSKSRAIRRESSNLSLATLNSGKWKVENGARLMQTSWDSVGFHKAERFGSIPKSATD